MLSFKDLILASWLPALTPLSAGEPAPFRPEAVIAGRVFDAESGSIVPATVILRSADGTVLTDHPSFRGGLRSSGVFVKTVGPGRVSRLRCSPDGIQAQIRELRERMSKRNGQLIDVFCVWVRWIMDLLPRPEVELRVPLNEARGTVQKL